MVDRGQVLKLFGIPEGDRKGEDWAHLLECQQREKTCLQAVSGLPHVAKYVTHGTDEQLGLFIITEPACTLSFEKVIEQCKVRSTSQG